MHKMFKKMKVALIAAAALFFSVGSLMAQDEAPVADEKLEAYVVVMDSVEVLRVQLSDTIKALIVGHDLMDGGRAYNAIKSAKGDTVKLAEEGISPEQIAAYEELQQQIETKQAELNEIFSEMVKEHVGVSEYNQIRKGLRSDDELKERYEAIIIERKEEQTGEGNSAAGTPETNK